MDDAAICSARIPGNADVGGLGVIISFCVMAWMTIVVAMIPVASSLRTESTADSWHRRLLWMCPKISERTLLILTGLSIIIAGCATFNDTAFYHLELLMNLWWLTLNSFWITRIELGPFQFASKDERDLPISLEEISARGMIRLIAALVSCILGVVYQSLLNVVRDRDWDSSNGKHCYRSHDDTNNWVWVAGLSLYTLAVGMSTVRCTRPAVYTWLKLLRNTQRELHAKCRRSWMAFNEVRRSSPSGLSILGIKMSGLGRLLVLAFWTSTTVIFWLVRNLLTAFSFGEGNYTVLFAVCAGFAAWSTYDIIDLRRSNAALLDSSEDNWGFGQILPMILMTSSIMQLLDAIHETGRSIR